MIADFAQNKSITIAKELFDRIGSWAASNPTQLFKERGIARDNDTLEGYRLFGFLERNTKVFDYLFPLRRKSAVRFFEIVVERRALAVDVLVAVMPCRALCLRADLPKITLGKFLDP